MNTASSGTKIDPSLCLYSIPCSFFLVLSWSLSCYFSITCMNLALRPVSAPAELGYRQSLWKYSVRKRRVSVKERKSLDDHVWYCCHILIWACIVGLTHKKAPCLTCIVTACRKRSSAVLKLEGNLIESNQSNLRLLCMLWLLTVRLLRLICLPCFLSLLMSAQPQKPFGMNHADS